MRMQLEQPCAAIIARVHSDTRINIAYFDENGHAHNRTGVRLIQDEKVGHGSPEPICTWMPFQAGQQAKAQAAEDALIATVKAARAAGPEVSY